MEGKNSMNKINDVGDKSAICLSFACVLHCILLPLMLIFLPTVTALNVISDESVHLWLVCAVAPISLLAVGFGYRYHGQVKVLVTNVAGVLVLISAILFGHDLWFGKGEIILTLTGSALIIFSHVKNLLLRQAKMCDTK